MKGKTNKKLLKALGKRIRKLREEQEISQAQLAFECSISIHRDQIGRIELGKQASSIVNLEAISKVLGMTLSELFDFEY